MVLVIRANRTVRHVAKNGLKQLNNVNAHMLGVVLNGVDMGRGSYYHYGENDTPEKTLARKKRSKRALGEDAVPMSS